MIASTCCEVPTVGWISLKRTHATRSYSGHGYRGPACYLMIRDSVARRMTLRSVDATLPLTIRLITIRALGEPGTYDTRVSICTGISSKLHCSAVSLVPMPLVSNIPASSYNTYRYLPIPLYYLPPPYYSYFLLSSYSTSLTDLCYLPPPPPQLLLAILPTSRSASTS